MGWDFTDARNRHARIPIWAMWFYRDAAEKYAFEVLGGWECSSHGLEPGDAALLAVAFQRALDQGENADVPAARIRAIIAFFQNCDEQYEVVG